MPKTLLLADDSITIQKVVGITFATEDYQITAVDNGEDALLKAKQLKPDIILADVVMPRKNGYELCEAVKSDPELQRVPVLLLAGTFEAFDEARARAARADGHIAKPFESQALLGRVKELVEGVKPEIQAASRPAAPAPQAAPRPAPKPVPVAAPQPAVARPAAPAPPAGARPPGAMPLPGGMPAARPLAGSPLGARPGAAPPGAGSRPAAPFSPGLGVPGPPGPAAPRPGMGPRPGIPPVGAPTARPAAPGGMPAGFRPAPTAAPPGARLPAPPARPAPARPAPAPPAAPAGAGAPAVPPSRAPAPEPSRARESFGLEVSPPPGSGPAAVGEDWGDLGLGLGPGGAGEEATPARTIRGAVPEEIALEEGQGAAPAPVDLPPVEAGEVELAPMHAFVPPPDLTGHRSEAAPRAPDGGEAALREALSKASLEVIERVVWEVVPQLAETIIRENLDRLAKERRGS